MKNKSEIERENMIAIIDALPIGEKLLVMQMVKSLMLSVASPKTGRQFMLAVAFVNTEVACKSIEMGIVKPDGSVDNETYPATKADEDKVLSALVKSLAEPRIHKR